MRFDVVGGGSDVVVMEGEKGVGFRCDSGVLFKVIIGYVADNTGFT